MKKAIKWGAIIVGGLVVIIILILLIAPAFIDINKYKPEIEKLVAENTGCTLTLGGDLDLSLFPWAGISISDVRMGNPKGFKEKDLVTIKNFEVRVKFLPLLSKEVQIKRFILEEARIVMVKNKDGRLNLQSIGKATAEKQKEKKEAPAPKAAGSGLPIKSLTVGNLAITKSSILFIDHTTGGKQEVSDLTLKLKDVSLDRPFKLSFSANLDGKPLSAEGTVGPIGKEPGKGTMSLDIAVKVLNELEMNIKGTVVDPAVSPKFDIAIDISPFSPRKLVEALGQPFPVKTTDPEALSKLALKASIKGDPNNVTISGGVLDLDQSRLNFSLKAKEFNKPNIAFDMTLNEIDLDRYLPPAGEEKAPQEKKEGPAVKTKTDYRPLRKLVVDGTIKVAKLKAKGATVQDILVKVRGKGGLFHLDPLSLKLYQGDVNAKGSFDARQDTPKSQMNLNAKGIQVGPLLKDVMKKEFLEGTTKADVSVTMSGDEPDRIKRTLNGKGDILFTDGALVGIDLAGMVRNVKTTFTGGEKPQEKPKTDFSEMHAPFTITNGVVHTPKTSMQSPLLRLLAAGKADLVQETLDFRVEPKFVGTIKGQGDSKDRSGVTVPVLVTGTFSSPKFRPDLKGLLQDSLKKGMGDPSELQKMIPGQSTDQGTGQTEGSGSIEDRAKSLMKSLPFGK
ncbi:MAG: AsmA family protein [Deltaproteobacteria bacterium]|nr:AsmA family protein [Deltaproteobacteria bacterium]